MAVDQIGRVVADPVNGKLNVVAGTRLGPGFSCDYYSSSYWVPTRDHHWGTPIWIRNAVMAVLMVWIPFVERVSAGECCRVPNAD